VKPNTYPIYLSELLGPDSKGELWLMPRPSPGENLSDDLSWLHAQGVATLVSLLEVSEANEMNLELEGSIASSLGLTFLQLPIPDRGTPRDATSFKQLVATLVAKLVQGEKIAVHCRAGIGRTGMVALAVLHSFGLTDPVAIVSQARRVQVPDTETQLQWVKEHFQSKGRPK